MKFPRAILLTTILGAAWVAAVALGMRALLNYEHKAGGVAAVPANFPEDAAVYLAKDQPTLVMLAHPRCGCTRATLGELAHIMAELQGKLKAYVLFAAPDDADADWNNSELWRTAAAIPGVTLVGDASGREARRFGAQTSGHALLFAADGRLLFSGGITSARGHAGDNAGERSIISLVRAERAEQSHTPVFGCSLVGSEAEPVRTAALR